MVQTEGPAGSRSKLPMGLSRRAVLRTGYAAVITLLVFASLEAYRIQSTVSEQHIDSYHRYVTQETAMTELRRVIWMTGNRVRDFFIDARPETAALLRTQLRTLETEGEKALHDLERTGCLERKPEVRLAMQDFWSLVEGLPDSMLRASTSERYAFVQREIAPRRSTLYSVLRELTETDQMELQRSEREFSQTRRTAARHLILLLVISVVLALLVAWFSLSHSDTLERAAQQQYEAVLMAKRELEALSARLVEIEEEDRKRLARELHDEIGQTLAVLQMEITHASTLGDDRLPAIRERLARARELADKTVQTVRNISLLLRPALLDDLGLIPALQWLLEDFMRRSGIRCELAENGVADQLPDPVKTCIYRVVQEAIHNAEKHSGAQRVRVSLRQTEELIEVEVEDDGRGFAIAADGGRVPGAGLGILGMRERAARMRGTLSLDSEPGRGTRLRLIIPAEAAARSAAEVVV